MNFEEKYSFYQELTEKSLKKYLPDVENEFEENRIPKRLNDAMQYTVFAGGKRLRPVMLLASYNSLVDDTSEAERFAAAIEMIHSYSLIHDDLPAIDNDDFRRGKPSNHRAFGVDYAILAGDALLSRAFEIMADSKSPYALKALKAIADYSGSCGMIAGQIIDICKSKKQTKESCIYIQKHKTADLFMAAVTSGLLLAGADEKMIEDCREFALNYGLAYQMTDDILDIVGDEKLLGKTKGKDEIEDKLTFVKMLGFYEAKKMAMDYADKAVGLSKSFKSNAPFFERLATDLINRKF